MSYLIYALAFLGVIFILVLFWFLNIVGKAKREMKLEPRSFKDAVELMSFIRNIFECEIKHNVVMYGFVELVYQDDLLQKEGLADESYLNINVVLVTKKGHEKVNTICGDITANINKGDFVAVLPSYNQRHNLWSYVTIAKLNTVYLGERGFSVKEEYIN